MIDYNKKYSYVSEEYQKKRPNYSMQSEVFNTENIFGDNYKSRPPSCTKLVNKKEDSIYRFTTKSSEDFIGSKAINHKKHFKETDHFKNNFDINKKEKNVKNTSVTKEDVINCKNINSKNFAKCKVLNDIYYTNPFEKIEISSNSNKGLRTYVNSKEKNKSSKIVENNQSDFDYLNFINNLHQKEELTNLKNKSNLNQMKRSESAKYITRGISIGFGCSTKHDKNESVSTLLRSQKSTPEIMTLNKNINYSKSASNSPRLTKNNKSNLISSLKNREIFKDLFKGESVKELLNETNKNIGFANNKKLNSYSLFNLNKNEYLDKKFSSSNIKNVMGSTSNRIHIPSDKITLSNVPSKSFLINSKRFKSNIYHSTKSLLV